MTRHTRLGTMLASLLAAALLVSAFAAPVSAQGRALVAHLKGASEVPGPGDPDGWGLAVIKRWSQTGDDNVCWFAVVRKIDLPPTGAHIHGPAVVGVAGPVLVPLTGFTLTRNVPAWAKGHGVAFSRGCTTAPDATLDAIWANPANYYVNIHSAAPFLGGAIRGQLG